MNAPDSFILDNFNEEKLKHIIFYIGQEYGKHSVIYASVGFCTKLADNTFFNKKMDNTISDDIFYKNLNKDDAIDTGLLGQYIGHTIICVPELNAINAVVVPDWCSFWNNYFENKKENE